MENKLLALAIVMFHIGLTYAGENMSTADLIDSEIEKTFSKIEEIQADNSVYIKSYLEQLKSIQSPEDYRRTRAGVLIDLAGFVSEIDSNSEDYLEKAKVAILKEESLNPSKDADAVVKKYKQKERVVIDFVNNYWKIIIKGTADIVVSAKDK